MDYSLNFGHDKDHSASLLTVVGTVGLMEGDKWNAYLHLTGWDPNLGENTFWDSQISGIKEFVSAFPAVNALTYQISQKYFHDDYIIFKIKLETNRQEKSVPVAVLDSENTYLTGDYLELISPSDLVIVQFIPYAYSLKEYYGISLSPKSVKIVKSGYLTKTAMDSTQLHPIIKSATVGTPTKSTKTIAPCVTPPTTNVGF